MATAVLLLAAAHVHPGEHSAKSPNVVEPYFGQDPPGSVPERFGPDSLLATDDYFWHGSPAFSPDLLEVHWTYYVEHPGAHEVELFFTEANGDQWTSPDHPPFANTDYGENNPFFSLSGDTLYFLSRRPGGFIFRVIRTPTGWSPPEPLNIPLPVNVGTGWQFSVARNRNVYFEIWGNGGVDPPDIYRSRWVNGQYQSPEDLGSVINTEHNEIMPFIDPDERYLLFDSNRPGGFGFHDIYISFRVGEDAWTTPINLGASINSATEDCWPLISPDGLYLFFATLKAGDLGFNPYWVDTAVIDSLQAVTPVEIKSWGQIKSLFHRQ
jgi:hypothetical protein